MGQKINPNILRLGVNKPWKTEFFEKKNQELPNYTFKTLEIKAYLERFLELHGILLHDYRQYFNNANITCYISYLVTPHFLLKTQNTKNKKILIVNNKGERKIVLKECSSTQKYLVKHTIKSNENYFDSYRNNFSSLKLKNYLKKNFQSNPKIPLTIKNDQEMRIKGLFKQIFKVINLFTGNQYKITFKFCCVNKKLNFNSLDNHKILMLLKRFKNTIFFKDGIELLFNVVSNRNSSNLLAKFIAIQIKTVKRHKFFLMFLKKTLTILINSEISKVDGIKIMLKGRINGAAKARHKTIVMGQVPLQTISKSVDYTQTCTHTSNGTYGVQVWIAEKH